MSYTDDRMNAMDAEINHLMCLKRDIRQREKSIKAREQYLANPSAFQFNSVKSLKGALDQALPAYMVPGNVGGINDVCWPFYFQVELDLGTDPSIASNIFTKSFFQVDQEAALLLMSVSRSHNTDAEGFSATVNAPIQVEFIDRTSSRRFDNAPIPVQMIGTNSCPTIFPTPFYFMPNAFMDVVINGIPDAAQKFEGSGEIQFSFFGYRIRTEDAGKILSTIYGQV